MNAAHIVFLSYDGMTDPLGQSQVIPYLAGLSKKGFQITIVSFEKSDRYEKFKDTIQNLLHQHHISWEPLSYTPKPPVFSTVYDLWQLFRKIKAIHKQKPIKLLHCRSYITSLAGLSFKFNHQIPFLFDMRAFYADERVDGGIWNLKNPVFNHIYSFFKKKELEFLTSANYTISLTNAGKKIIHSWNTIPNQPIPIQVIPCCADLNHFDFHSLQTNKLEEFQRKLGLKPKETVISPDRELVVSYLGSLGTWYMEKEMFQFFKVLKSKYPLAKFLIITPDSKESIVKKAAENQVNEKDLVIIFGNRADVPTLVSLSHFSLFFIQPLFSKQGSSPTKHGEILGMGVPVVCNTGVGDVEEIVTSTNSGLLVHHFQENDYLQVITNLPGLISRPPTDFRNAAIQWYSLESGINRYFEVYQAILNT